MFYFSEFSCFNICLFYYVFGNATDLRWVVMGNPRLEFYASAPVNGITSITLSGADFGGIGQQFIYLIGETDFGSTIFANMGVTVIN